MKNYKITVNGNTYDVTVEENGEMVSSAPARAAAPAPAVKKPVSSGNQGSIKVESPMVGKILAVKIKVGDSVKKGQVIMILEAMKMENEIVAPEDGTVVSVDVSEGTQLEAGALLATLN